MQRVYRHGYSATRGEIDPATLWSGCTSLGYVESVKVGRSWRKVPHMRIRSVGRPLIRRFYNP